jgi:uncharacterized membrane protein (UPF0127 family)
MSLNPSSAKKLLLSRNELLQFIHLQLQIMIYYSTIKYKNNADFIMINFVSLQYRFDRSSLFYLISTFSFLFLIIMFNGHIVFSLNATNNNTNTTITNLLPYVKIKDLVIHVDLAITPDEQAKGLSIKTALNDSEGMLFPFETPGDYSFWMKDMKFPIDIIWIDSNNKIIHIEKNLQPCVFFILCPSYSPHANSKYVLEVNSNFTSKNNITVGDNVYFNIPKSKII